ncbi:hypothetical protein [Saccharothrix sp. Mg75]
MSLAVMAFSNAADRLQSALAWVGLESQVDVTLSRMARRNGVEVEDRFQW